MWFSYKLDGFYIFIRNIGAFYQQYSQWAKTHDKNVILEIILFLKFFKGIRRVNENVKKIDFNPWSNCIITSTRPLMNSKIFTLFSKFWLNVEHFTQQKNYLTWFQQWQEFDSINSNVFQFHKYAIVPSLDWLLDWCTSIFSHMHYQKENYVNILLFYFE